jgi:hypothetical protein
MTAEGFLDGFGVLGGDLEERFRRAMWMAAALFQLRSVATLTPIIMANSSCDFLSFFRMACTSSGVNVNSREGCASPRRIRPASRTLSISSSKSSGFI